MGSKTDLDALVLLSDDELNERIRGAATRVQTRIQRCETENRSLTERERALSEDDRSELVALKDATEIRAARRAQADAIETRSKEIVTAVDAAIRDHHSGGVETRSAFGPNSLVVSDEHLEDHARALRDGRPHGAVETRARVTVSGDLGSAGAWDGGHPNEPRTLISFANIRVAELTGRTAQTPVYTGPTGAAGVDESTAHGEFDAVNPATLTGLRYGRWTQVSALANVVDDLRSISQMHSWGIARDLDLLAVSAIQTAASTPVALGDDLDQQVRQALLTVSANTYSDESQLVIVGTPADLSLLTGTTPANGDDRGSVANRYAGARLYPLNSAAAEQVTVFAPSAFVVFQTRLQSATAIDPTDGSNKFGSWLHSTPVAAQIAGAAVAVATAE